MAMIVSDLNAMLVGAFPNAKIDISDLAGDGDHYAVEIIDPSFAGKSRVEQHQMVYRALGTKMGTQLHAMALKTSAPKN